MMTKDKMQQTATSVAERDGRRNSNTSAFLDSSSELTQGRQERHSFIRSVMMRIAIAGGGGLGYLIASQLASADTAYNVIVLSRTVRPEFYAMDIQCHAVDYEDQESLAYALQGIDLVISTISGQEQINLIAACRSVRVRTFVPSEFEGALSRRPAGPCPLYEGSRQTLDLLNRIKGMKYTVFSCGLFMERFHPEGLTHFNIGYRSGVPGPGEFLVNCRDGTAEYPSRDSRGKSIKVCLTSVYDLAKFIVAAVELGPRDWPREFTLRGDRISVSDLVRTCATVINTPIEQNIVDQQQIRQYAEYYYSVGDQARTMYYYQLSAVAEGRYDFSTATLNDVIDRHRRIEVQAITFAQVFSRVWRR